MAQRWMQAKLTIAKTHGRAVSGAGAVSGDVMDDRSIGRLYAEPKPAPKPQARRVMLKAVRPTAWQPGGDAFTC